MPGHNHLVFYNPKYRWRASYRLSSDRVVQIDDSEISECPVSAVSPEITETVASLELAAQIRKSTGESPLPHVRAWPVRLLDAQQIIAVESLKRTHAIQQAED